MLCYIICIMTSLSHIDVLYAEIVEGSVLNVLFFVLSDDEN